MPAVIRFIVVLFMSKSVPKLVAALQAVLAAMTNNTWFPNAAAQIAAAQANLTALDLAEKAISTKALDAVPARDAKLKLVISDAAGLKALVQKTCDDHPADAETIAKSANMGGRKRSAGQKAILRAKAGALTSTVILYALKVLGAGSYEWQMSLDEKVWINLPSTKHCKTTVANLTLGATYYFRVHAILAAGPTNWTQPVSIIVT